MGPEDTEDQFWICKIEKIFTKEPKYSVAWFELIDDMYPLIFISSLSVSSFVSRRSRVRSPASAKFFIINFYFDFCIIFL